MGGGLGPGLDFFGPQVSHAYQLDAMSQGPKSLDFHGTIPLPLVLVMDAAVQGHINHRCIGDADRTQDCCDIGIDS